MIRHTVVFTLKDASLAGPFFTAAKKLADIKGVQNFECLKQVSGKNKFEYGLSMEFATQGLYDQYSNHPAHIAFVQEFWMKDVEDFLEIDYEPLK